MSIFHCSARMPGGGSGTPEGTKWSPTIVINGWTWCTYQWPKKMPKIYVLPSLKLTYIAPEHGCLENFLVSFWDRFPAYFFRGKLAVSFQGASFHWSYGAQLRRRSCLPYRGLPRLSVVKRIHVSLKPWVVTSCCKRQPALAASIGVWGGM